MKIKNRIGCLEKGSTNYDETASIMCRGCCSNVEKDEVTRQFLELLSSDTTTEVSSVKISSCVDNNKGNTQGGVVVWDISTSVEKQQECCYGLSNDGYIWDRFGRRCVIDNGVVFTEEVGNRSVIGYDGLIPIWYTMGSALEHSKIIGCQGYQTHNIDGRNGYISCGNKSQTNKEYSPQNCTMGETRFDGTITFNGIKNNGVNMESCCQQWREYGDIWDGSSCRPLATPLTWSCVRGVVTEIYDGSGEYGSFNGCLTMCDGKVGDLTYDCDFGQCRVNSTGDGEYFGRRALSNCLEGCNNCGDQPICCDLDANNCDTRCKLALKYNSCACDNNKCSYINLR